MDPLLGTVSISDDGLEGSRLLDPGCLNWLKGVVMVLRPQGDGVQDGVVLANAVELVGRILSVGSLNIEMFILFYEAS